MQNGKAGDCSVPMQNGKAGDCSVPMQNGKAGDCYVPMQNGKAGDCSVPMQNGKAGDCSVPMQNGKAGDCSVPMQNGKAGDCSVPTQNGKAGDCGRSLTQQIVGVQAECKRTRAAPRGLIRAVGPTLKQDVNQDPAPFFESFRDSDVRVGNHPSGMNRQHFGNSLPF